MLGLRRVPASAARDENIGDVRTEQRPRVPVRGLFVALAGAVVLTACSDGPSDEEVMVEAISASILQDETFTGYGIVQGEADCVAEATVSGLGVGRMSELGFGGDTPADEAIDLAQLDDDEVRVLAQSMQDCIDDVDDVLVDTVAASILEDPEPTFPIDRTQARCVAQAVIDEIPAARLITIGVQGDRSDETVSDLRPAEIDVFAGAYTSCIDVRTILLDGIAASGTANDEELACLDDNISDDDIETIFTAGLAGEDTAATAQRILSPAVTTCTGR